jgi:hypothetical protein
MAGPSASKRHPGKGGSTPNRRSAGPGDDSTPSKKPAGDGESDLALLPGTEGSQTDLPPADDTGSTESDVSSPGEAGGTAVVVATRQLDDASSEKPAVYESPLKRVRRAIERGANKRVIDSARGESSLRCGY